MNLNPKAVEKKTGRKVRVLEIGPRFVTFEFIKAGKGGRKGRRATLFGSDFTDRFKFCK